MKIVLEVELDATDYDVQSLNFSTNFLGFYLLPQSVHLPEVDMMN
jgi:hypothetical protein